MDTALGSPRAETSSARPPATVTIFSKCAIYAVRSIDTQAQTWAGEVDMTLLVPLGAAQLASLGEPSRNRDDISETERGGTLWASLGLRAANRVDIAEGTLEVWQRVATETSTYTIRDIPGRAAGDTLFILRWRFAGTFSNPFQLRAYPMDSQLLHLDILTTRDEVRFAGAQELAAFNALWCSNHPEWRSSHGAVDRFKVVWAASPVASEFALAPDVLFSPGDVGGKAMEPPHVFSEHVSHASREHTHRRFAFTVFRRPWDVIINICAPVFFCTALGLLTAIGVPAAAGDPKDGDLSTSASFFMASLSIRGLTASACPKMSTVTALEAFLAASMTLHVFAFVEKSVGFGDGRMEASMWLAFFSLNVCALAALLSRGCFAAREAGAAMKAGGSSARLPLLAATAAGLLAFWMGRKGGGAPL
jgi:hypothetical protein